MPDTIGFPASLAPDKPQNTSASASREDALHTRADARYELAERAPVEVTDLLRVTGKSEARVRSAQLLTGKRRRERR
jgi:hypothetical protein